MSKQSQLTKNAMFLFQILNAINEQEHAELLQLIASNPREAERQIKNRIETYNKKLSSGSEQRLVRTIKTL